MTSSQLFRQTDAPIHTDFPDKTYYAETVVHLALSNYHFRFQYVAMQIEILKRKSINRDIEKALLNLPVGLEETYNRALINWNADSFEWGRTIRALNWLAFSFEPLTLSQLAEAMIIDPRDDPPFDKEGRLHRPENLLHLLTGLVTVDDDEEEEEEEDQTKDSSNSIRLASAPSVLDEDYQDEDGSSAETSDGSAADGVPTQDNRIVRFAHFSVKEYLISDRIEAVFPHISKPVLPTALETGSLWTYQLSSIAQWRCTFHSKNPKPMF
ncbi:hypothetical protein BDZ45DRAFT_692164 [Acephala macrosclerotiorum]|nr:hypothetical protein BDZ45DRAFT_692164 [Acephala macrosclerotiorum]